MILTRAVFACLFLAHYRELAKKRGQEFINVYDIGWRRNLELFFNIGPGSP